MLIAIIRNYLIFLFHQFLLKFRDQVYFSYKVLFQNLTPLHPANRLTLEQGNGSKEDLTARIIDMASPIGKGQRGLIVSPPKAGKTILLQNIDLFAANKYDTLLFRKF